MAGFELGGTEAVDATTADGGIIVSTSDVIVM
jgi:hypothetical protein